jgi:uncharacterized membrane protein YjgN (DUF898 family)
MNDLGAPMTVLYVEESGSQAQRLVFNGSGAGYFRVWVTGVLLTVATAGIYAAWAKVRRMRYFCENTSLGHACFAYHGTAQAILRGRMVALLFLAACVVSWQIAAAAGLLMSAVLAVLLPWLNWKTLQFKLHNSSYRGIRFACGGTAQRVYLVYLLMPAMTMFSLGMLAPFSHHRLRKFQLEESRFGATYFSFHAGAGQYYILYAKALALGIAGLALIAYGFNGLFAEIGRAGGLRQAGNAAERQFLAFLFVVYLWMSLVTTVAGALLQKIVWNRTRLGGHQFRCEISIGKTAWIAVSNLAAVIVTLGLFVPFAQVRMLRHRLESVTFIPAGSLDGYIETSHGIVTATGDALGETLEFDLSL